VQIQTVLSTAAIVLSSTSLAWQVWTWSRTGPRVTAEVRFGNGTYPSITVRNHGRAAMTVDSVRLHETRFYGTQPGHGLPDHMPQLAGPDLPHRLESLSSATWVYPVEGIRPAECG
jgi:hypothetical protein